MKFEVYCDETLPDLYTSQKPAGQFLMIGSLWLSADIRSLAKQRISELRAKYSMFGEIKWRKISPSSQAFYTELIDLFMSFGLEMRFRCMAVNRTEVNMVQLKGDAELGFYKFYYQAIHHWILDNNDYHIFCDLKQNRDRSRLSTLRTVLGHANRTSTIEAIQSIPSREVVLIQLCDVLLGAISARINEKKRLGQGKTAIVEHLERRLGRDRLGPTQAAERKFNVFRIRLQGGW